MKKKAIKKVKRINKKKHNRFLPILFFALGIVAIISTVYIVTTQWTELRSRAQTTKGWLSGASDIAGEIDGKAQPEKHWTKFEQWRGSPVTIAGTWSDSTAADQENMWAYNNYQSFTENLDLSVGAIYDGETFADAASGKLDARYKKALANIDKTWNSKKTIFLRYAHEFNGDWYPWKVTKSNVEDYKKAFQHFHSLVQSELVAKGRSAKLTWSPNDGSKSDASAEQMYPGSEYVDVIGVDSYDWDPQRTESNWESAANAKEGDGSPRGIEAWRQFALAKGKPIAFPEWGCDPDKNKPPVDCPFYIKKMNEFFRTNAGTGPGQVWYEIYFNSWDKSKIFPTTSVPQAAAMYKSLKWGDGGVVANPSTTLPSTNTPSQTVISVSPPFVCGGSQYCVPSTTVPPENPGTNPPVVITQTVDPSGVVENPQENPDGNNDENDNDNDGDNNGNDNDKKHGGGKGLFDLLLELFRLIIEFFMKLFGK